MEFLIPYGEAARTAVGFFWKAGWAFVLGYAVSAMIQAFVPKGRLTPFMGRPDVRSVSLATLFGAASSSCSFAALAAARALLVKGAHFVAAVAFMFASTNLVIELGILILIFLGWQFLAAEIAGGLLLIAISSILIRLTYPRTWIREARESAREGTDEEDHDFDWRERIRTAEGWNLVGHRFVSDWKMVWREILIGFTIAGFVAVLVPATLWQTIFLADAPGWLPGWVIALENAVVAPFVAAATFIGSMGNIPLATLLNNSGVMFAGVMGFIYSDLMVPPLVAINAKYYGWRVALYIAGIMLISIVLTAIFMQVVFAALGIAPESGRRVAEVTRFALDYTFYLNVLFIAVALEMIWLHRRHTKVHGKMQHEMEGDSRTKRVVALVAAGILVIGFLLSLSTDKAVDEAEAQAEPQAEPPAQPQAEQPSLFDELPETFARPLEPWKGDLQGMIDRQLIRVFVPYGGYQYYYFRGRPRGAVVELMQRLERYLNKKLGLRNIRVHVVVLPVSRDRVLAGLTAGTADLAAGDFTITTEREELYEFTRPLLRDINEVVVTGPTSAPLGSLEDLAGKDVYVRESSSYYEHLTRLSHEYVGRGLAPISIEPADELLEAEDILEMLAAGSISLTVFDDYKARFWADVFPNITVRDDLVLNRGGSIAWAYRPGSPQLAALLDEFLRKYGRGTLVGNDTFNRYLEDAGRIHCQSSLGSTRRYADLISSFKRFGKRYGFDWLMLAAQGYQESRLSQDAKSSTGAVGVMQMRPSTAADPNVGIPDISSADDNIHAGAKYMRFLADRYFSDDLDLLQQWLLTLAAYNSGPRRVAHLRNMATKEGYDRDRWFNNVEIIAARQIGAETVGYVSNVYKYHVGYKLADVKMQEQADRRGAVLTGCNNGD